MASIQAKNPRVGNEMNAQTIRQILNAYGKTVNGIHSQEMTPAYCDEKEITGMVQDTLNHPHLHRSES
ncbi:MAG: hypothetical protein PXX83_00420 [Candidatus Nitrosotalea sp.]|nr:hypothetical protein [Candidatus Nitrosotalea sp.]